MPHYREQAVAPGATVGAGTHRRTRAERRGGSVSEDVFEKGTPSISGNTLDLCATLEAICVRLVCQPRNFPGVPERVVCPQRRPKMRVSFKVFANASALDRPSPNSFRKVSTPTGWLTGLTRVAAKPSPLELSQYRQTAVCAGVPPRRAANRANSLLS